MQKHQVCLLVSSWMSSFSPYFFIDVLHIFYFFMNILNPFFSISVLSGISPISTNFFLDLLFLLFLLELPRGEFLAPKQLNSWIFSPLGEIWYTVYPGDWAFVKNEDWIAQYFPYINRKVLPDVFLTRKLVVVKSLGRVIVQRVNWKAVLKPIQFGQPKSKNWLISPNGQFYSDFLEKLNN